MTDAFVSIATLLFRAHHGESTMRALSLSPCVVSSSRSWNARMTRTLPCCGAFILIRWRSASVLACFSFMSSSAMASARESAARAASASAASAAS
eukprot:1450927-Prymnesium_polylepis.2